MILKDLKKGNHNFTRLIITLTILLANSISAKVYDKCSLTQDLRGLVPEEQIPTWVCIASHESGFDTTAINEQNPDGSWDHGLFQLSDRYWVGRDGPGGECQLSSSEVRDDDITNDVECILKVYAEHERLSGNGFNAWAVYSGQGHCQTDVAEWSEGCY